MKVAITGASGFLGSHCVANAVNKGYSVRVLVRNTEKAKKALQMHDVDKMREEFEDSLESENDEEEACEGCGWWKPQCKCEE